MTLTILAIDPGLTQRNPCGLALLRDDAPLTLLTTATVVPVGEHWSERLDWLTLWFEQQLSLHAPDIVAYEAAHYTNNVQTTIRIAQIGASVRALAVARGAQAVEVQPAQAKQALTRSAQATKTEMIRQVALEFGVEIVKDAADAVGVGVAGLALAKQARLVREAA